MARDLKVDKVSPEKHNARVCEGGESRHGGVLQELECRRNSLLHFRRKIGKTHPMSKKMLYASVMIVLTVVVLLLNRQGVSIRLGFTSLSMPAAFAYLIFTVVGGAIGMLMK